MCRSFEKLNVERATFESLPLSMFYKHTQIWIEFWVAAGISLKAQVSDEQSKIKTKILFAIGFLINGIFCFTSISLFCFETVRLSGN